jgi:hypothetical protein
LAGRTGPCHAADSRPREAHAELLGENSDEWIARAGRVPEDLPEIIRKQPIEIPELLREASGLTAEQLRKLWEQAKKLKERGD